MDDLPTTLVQQDVRTTSARRSTLAMLLWTSLFPVFANTTAQRIRVALSDAMNPPFSFNVDGRPQGMLIDLLNALFERIAGHTLEYNAFPWPRAQVYVQRGDMELFCTYPSEVRKAYAEFSTIPLYTIDYGYLIFNKDNPRRGQIESAKSFHDLRDLVFVSQESVAWEAENVPSFITRYMVNQSDGLFHMTLRRNVGDFFIMSVEQASHAAKRLNYEDQWDAVKVHFIPNSMVDFHVGISKAYADHAALVAAINSVMRDKDFKNLANAITKRYRTPSRTKP